MGVVGGIFRGVFGGCVAWIFEELWRELGGKNVLRKLTKNSFNTVILFFYYLFC